MKTVGVFDSGVGGLSVLRALPAQLPGTRFVYLADGAFTPYGGRTAAQVIDRSRRIADSLRERHAIDALVVACNTATALAIDDLRARHPELPIVGVEPALKPASLLSASGRIGVLATRGTLGSERYARLRDRLVAASPRPLHVHDQPCDGLADAIEAGDPARMQALCERYLDMLRRDAGRALDTLVLGCTHYPFAADIIAWLAGPGVALVDTAEAVARRTSDLLGEETARPATAPPPPLLLTTGEPATLAQAARRWLRMDAAAGHLNV